MGAPQIPYPPYKPQLLMSAPGIQRDGTKLARDNYMAGEWCRFYLDMPRKILGYRELKRDLDGICRQLDVQSYDGFSYVHAGMPTALQRFTIDLNSGLTSGLIDRTPSGFVANPNNNWQFSLVYDTANNANLLLAHAAPNILDISNTDERPVYFGEVRDTAALAAISGSDVSGGVCALWPYFLRFGNDGEVGWPVPGDITDLSGTGSGTARPWGTKIVRGLPIRGTSGPSALLWALDALIRIQFVGGTAIFAFDTLTTTSALLSSNSVIEHNGVYYWATVSGHSMFNGVIRDLDNDMNRQFILDNLNWPYRQKAFVFKIPRWNEIWWCYPLFGATECNWAIIYNYNKGWWYDTPLPPVGGGFSAGVYEQIFHYPLVTSPAVNDETTGTSVWQHDFGVNEISGAVSTSKAIRSFFQTHEYNLVAPNQMGVLGDSKTMSFHLIEPDFNQVGDLSISVLSRANARANTRRFGPVTVPAVPTGSQQIVKLKATGRLNSFVVVSNTLDGYFEGGDPVLHWAPADGRTEDGGNDPTVLQDDVLTADFALRDPAS